MSAIELKSSIVNILDETRDEEILEAYYQILLNLLRVQSRAVAGYDADGRPMTDVDLREAANSASARIASGYFIRHEDAKKQAENW